MIWCMLCICRREVSVLLVKQTNIDFGTRPTSTDVEIAIAYSYRRARTHVDIPGCQVPSRASRIINSSAESTYSGAELKTSRVPLRTSQFKHILKLRAGEIPGTRWAKCPLGRCRRVGPGMGTRGPGLPGHHPLRARARLTLPGAAPVGDLRPFGHSPAEAPRSELPGRLERCCREGWLFDVF